ncbi:MAG TPA: alpha/beta hydrolase [Kamptonema sp.]|nr:alpha/beta hydrolase [Kamptonema sp.]
MNRLLLSLSKGAKRGLLPIALRYLGWCGIAALAATPALGAERVYVTYGPLEISVPVKSLEVFVETGVVDDNWDGFAQYVNQQQLAQLRQALQAKAEVSPVTISQFLYTSQGEVLLQRLGRVIQTKGRQPGFYAIRAALILAAADPEGLTPVNVLKKFPTYGIRIDVARGLAVVNQLTGLVNRSNRAIAGVIQLANAQAASEPVNSSGLQDPERRGSFTWEKVSLTLTNDRRGRTFPLDLYLPTGNPKPAPVIVISHGLGSDRISFAYLAEHLASYGFVVAVPEHPGSNAQQLQNLVVGRANEVSQAAEFIDRPLDVKDVLDFLTSLSASDPKYQGQMDLQKVGVIGQSFGGYTALALAGGGVNFDQLDKDCQQESETWNISLLLQCRVKTLPRKDYNLIDSRVKAAIAINPIISSVLGEANISQIKIPVMILAGSADTIAPAVVEQIQPFTWLTNPEKYLVLLNNGTHFSTIDESPQSVFRVPTDALGPEPALARYYLNGLSVAFMETYLLNQSSFRRNLQPSYAKTISRDVLGLSILRSLTTEQFQKLLSGTATPVLPASPPQPVPAKP